MKDREATSLTISRVTISKTPFIHIGWLIQDSTYNFKLYIIYAEATNLFNKKYVDVGSISQPGRWITAGVKFEINDF